ncbi:hypothetical protein VKT23_010798 [Stygiomarasmius scandens]|uniref:Carbohydrate esterase family 16 protein n=1 Tax=Marasmiellus scandens TaxID=2682957 RepID=A0ABR1JAV3_9AGAR
MWWGLLFLLVSLQVGGKNIKHVVLFGDSFTDQSRAHSISNGSFPGKDYQEVFPPVDTAADGGVQWPWYLGLYGNYTIWNYAVGGAVCDNDLTPLFGVPDVLNGQPDWFILDHITGNGTSHQKLFLNPEEFVVIIWVGTNDVGINSFVTDDQRTNVSLVDLAECQMNTLKRMHSLGARQFILNSLIPLHLTKLYSNSSDPVIYWPEEHDGPAWHKRMFNIVNTLNVLLRAGIRDLNDQWAKGAGGYVEYFDAYSFFEEMYHHPAAYFNGSIPATVTNWCHKCPNPFDFHSCGIGDCTETERDSYMWWDELHPSEQTGRNVAMELLKKIRGSSKF